MIAATILAAVTIAFPKAGQKLPFVERCYMIGAVSGGETNIVIQGRDVPVYRTGAWVTMVDCTEGSNVVDVAGSNHWFSVARRPKPPTTTNTVPPKVYKKLPYASDTPKPHPSTLISPTSSLPPPPSSLTLVLDAGHGGPDTGAVSPHNLPEKTANLCMANAVRDELTALGFRVVMTREDDTFIPLYDRPKVAHTNGAVAFVSIHHNAPPFDKDPRLFRYHAVYTWNDLGKRLGAAINRRMAETFGDTLVNNGLPHANFAVTRNPEIPSCLIEVDFITTPESEVDCWDPERRKRVAKAIADGISDWSKSAE